MNDSLYQKLKAALMVVAIGAMLFGIFAAIRWSDSLYPSRTISVSAEGRAWVLPDIANLFFSVVSEGTDPEKLQTDSNAKMKSAINMVKSIGVDEKDIKTTGYNLNPTYQYDEKTRRSYISGYTLTQAVGVKVRDLGKVAKVLGGLPELGINQIGTVSFGVEDPDKYLADARSEAFGKARAKAEEMAMKNGVTLGRVQNFSEYLGGGPVPYYAKGMGGGEVATPASIPTIEPGSQEITVQVSVTYALK